MIKETIKMDIRMLPKAQIKQWVEAIGEKKYRAGQIYEWLWQKSAHSFDEMSNLSKGLRDLMEKTFVIRPIEIDKVQKSVDGTIKTRFKLHDGHLIESVLIPVPRDNRYTVCVSTQVGCSLTCKFCATGKMKRVRNLDAAEIYDQVVLVNRQAEEIFDHPLTNIVYMGMGEPLLAYKSMMKSVEHITSPEGLNMSPKRITVSTAGIAKAILRLAEDEVKFNLALSLHAADDEKRNEIMPINESNNLSVLMAAIKEFYRLTKNRISFEYIMLQDVNDDIEDARKLAKLCGHFPVRVNIIEYNPIENAEFVKTAIDKMDAFANYLTDQGIVVTVRRSRGKDIDAACGQLANKE